MFGVFLSPAAGIPQGTPSAQYEKKPQPRLKSLAKRKKPAAYYYYEAKQISLSWCPPSSFAPRLPYTTCGKRGEKVIAERGGGGEKRGSPGPFVFLPGSIALGKRRIWEIERRKRSFYFVFLLYAALYVAYSIQDITRNNAQCVLECSTKHNGKKESKESPIFLFLPFAELLSTAAFAGKRFRGRELRVSTHKRS